MRIANTMVYNMIKSNLSESNSALNDATETASTGNRINSLSDDPIGVSKALNIRSNLDGFKQVERGISLGNSWLTATENALTQAQKLVTDTKTLAIQMANASVNAQDRKSAAGIVQNTLEELVSLANAKVGDRSIFSGSSTDKSAFTLQTSDPVTGELKNTVSYNGDKTPFSIKIGDSTVAIGNDGGAIFESLFNTLDDFKTALKEDGGNQEDLIQDALKEFETQFDQLNAAISTVGTKMNRMDMKSNLYQDLKISETKRLSGIEDVDITDAITDLQQKQTAYQAALATSSKVMKIRSLVDYL